MAWRRWRLVAAASGIAAAHISGVNIAYRRRKARIKHRAAAIVGDIARLCAGGGAAAQRKSRQRKASRVLAAAGSATRGAMLRKMARGVIKHRAWRRLGAANARHPASAARGKRRGSICVWLAHAWRASCLALISIAARGRQTARGASSKQRKLRRRTSDRAKTWRRRHGVAAAKRAKIDRRHQSAAWRRAVCAHEASAKIENQRK